MNNKTAAITEKCRLTGKHRPYYNFAKHMKSLLLSIIICSALTGCSPAIKTFTDYDRNYQIQKNKTYSWESLSRSELENHPLFYNELNDKRIRAAADEILSAKGYVLADSVSDLSLHYHIVMAERSAFEPEPYRLFMSNYPNPVQSQVYQYQEGTLIIDFGKGSNKDLIWRGWAVKAFDNVLYRPEETESIIRSVVTEILKKLPASESR